MSGMGLLEVDFEGRWLRLEASWLGQVKLMVDGKVRDSKLKWFKSSDAPLVMTSLSDGTDVEGYAKTDGNTGRIRFAISVNGRLPGVRSALLAGRL